MYLQEYQAKNILKANGINIPKSVLISDLSEVKNAYETVGSPICVIKAQVLSGARGKAGGILLAKSLSEAQEFSQKLLRTKLITGQNQNGLPINKLLLEEGLNIEKELYLSITIDRSSQSISLIASPNGGGDIEEVAKNTPELIYAVDININSGLDLESCKNIADKLKVNKDKFLDLITKLYNIFTDNNCNLIEINPLIISKDNLIPLDCKIEIDDNALFKHPELLQLRDTTQENEKELLAAEYGLNYISLDGEIGCMVNGAGLAMATMDLIKHHGGSPANFLDVGGGTDSTKVAKAIEIIRGEKNIKAILINIFGGIVRCDLIAKGIIDAIKNTQTNLPIVVRLEGTNADIGLEILAKSGLKIISENNLELAAKKVVEVAQ